MLPPSPLEWLPADDLAYFLLDGVEELDLSGIEEAAERKDPRGESPYAPAMMVALLLYSYGTGLFSSRKIARGTWRDVALRVIAAGEHPHWTTINPFRLEHRQALGALFAQGLALCRKAGLVGLAQVAPDGTKVAANASRHKAMSASRMSSEERRLAAEGEALLAAAEEVDREEDALYGPQGEGQSVPEELAIRAKRLARIREAKEALEREAAAARAERLRELAAGQQQKGEDERVEPAERERARRRAAKSRRQAEELERRARAGQLPLEEPPEGGKRTGRTTAWPPGPTESRIRRRSATSPIRTAAS